MFSKIIIFSCLVATGFGYFYAHGPNCKVEVQEVEAQLCHIKPTKVCGTEVDGEVIFQKIVPDEPVCVDVVDKHCLPHKVPEDGCKEHTRKVCVPADKVVDVPSGKIPEPYAAEEVCRILPKAECEAKVHKVPKTVCEPVEAKPYFYGYHF